jgi:hypothetical protein
MDDPEGLRRRAEALRLQADALAGAYRRATWLRFTLVFFPVPFVVVLLRLQVESWTYFLYGGAYVGLSALLYMWDGRESARCDAAEQAALAAEQAAGIIRAG